MESTEQSRTCTDAPRVTTLRPRPAPPRQRLTARPLARDLWDAHHADRAFGDDDGPAIPRIPSPRQPSDYGSAA
jgi:hypothetical protein